MTYIVAYKRDVKTEQTKLYGSVHLYDRMKTFEEKSTALQFVYQNLPAIMLQSLEQVTIGANETYGVLIHHKGKYKSYDYGGGCDWLDSYDFHRVEQSGIEALITKEMSVSKARGFYIGIEQKLF